MKTARYVTPIEQGELLPVEHEGVFPSRNSLPPGDKQVWKRMRRVNAEAFYARAWKKFNASDDALSMILCGDVARQKGYGRVQYSRRDAQVAATIIQWLGTNVGRAFVETVEEEIKRTEAHRRTVQSQRRAVDIRVDQRTPLQRRIERFRDGKAALLASVNREIQAEK